MPTKSWARSDDANVMVANRASLSCKLLEPETLWSEHGNGRRTDCVIVGVGEFGWEIRLLSDGGEFYARWWMLRAEAFGGSRRTAARLRTHAMAKGLTAQPLPSRQNARQSTPQPFPVAVP